MEDNNENDGKAMTGRLNVHQIENIKKELLALKERLVHMQVSVFGENQSMVRLIEAYASTLSISKVGLAKAATPTCIV